MLPFSNRRDLKVYRKNLRKNSTTAERVLWHCLRNQQLVGRKFRRQHSIGPYILDFYCFEESLGVELDGAGHFTPKGKSYDARRDKYLASHGIKIIRFENCEVFDDVVLVLRKIVAAFKQK